MYLIFTLGILSFLFSLALTPLIRDALRHRSVIDQPDSFRKRHEAAVPRVGGIAIAISYLAAFGVVLLMPFTYASQIRPVLPEIWKLIPAAGIVFGVGLLDDVKGLRPWHKLLGQTVAACVAYWAGVSVQVISGHPLEPWLSFPVTVLWLVACTNALNLIDGVDGLATGLGLVASLTMLVAALLHQNLSLVVVVVPLAGSLLGFLRYNFNPASVFLGDCGSLLIGFLLGTFGAIWSHKSATALGMMVPMMAIAIPLLDTGLAVIRRFLRHQPIFGADRSHIHHRLLDKGLTPRQVVTLLYGACCLAAAFSLVQAALHNQFSGLIIVLFAVSAFIGIRSLGYAEFGVARDMLFKGTFQKMIDAQTRLQHFEASLEAVSTVPQLWDALVTGGRDLGFHGVRARILGQVMEEEFAGRENGACWQLRIPLSEGQYINYHRDFKTELSPLVIGALVRMVESRVGAKLATLEGELEEKPVGRAMAAGL
jgi:UDP-GlcNAc:undecaprenyl-phosphate GlcNAc-1-phosphate transferase